jgi:hypothetical protein
VDAFEPTAGGSGGAAQLLVGRTIHEISILGLTPRIPVCEDGESMLAEMPGVGTLRKSAAAVRDVGVHPPVLCREQACTGRSLECLLSEIISIGQMRVREPASRADFLSADESG